MHQKNSIFVSNFLYKYAAFTDTNFIIKMCDIISLDQWSMFSYAFHHIIKYLSATNHLMIHLESSEPKNGPSSDCRLQPAYTKLELLVIADQHAAVNTFPGLVHTARHTMGVCNTRSQ